MAKGIEHLTSAMEAMNMEKGKRLYEALCELRDSVVKFIFTVLL
jgi:hypothetical protein